MPAATGLVISSETEQVITQDGVHDQAKLRYQYFISGKRYENETISFGVFRGMATWGYTDRKLRQYHEGRMVKVYYNPKDLNTSCLEVGGFGWEDGMMFVVSIVGVYMGAKRRREFFKWIRERRAVQSFATMNAE